MTLIRANLNDLLDRAEDPETMFRNLLSDLNNHQIQVKTAVAQSLADQVLLEKRLEQTRAEMQEAERKAEQAVRDRNDRLARAALERHNSLQRTAEETGRQLEEQRKETESLKSALAQIEIKVAEVTRQRDLLLARHRRAAAKRKLAEARPDLKSERLEEILNAIEGLVDQAEAKASAAAHLQQLGQSAARHQLARLEKEDLIDQQLRQLKEKIAGTGDPSA